jgi:hypothetical protein
MDHNEYGNKGSSIKSSSKNLCLNFVKNNIAKAIETKYYSK